MKYKSIISLLLCVAVLISVLSGCISSVPTSTLSDDNNQETTAPGTTEDVETEVDTESENTEDDFIVPDPTLGVTPLPSPTETPDTEIPLSEHVVSSFDELKLLLDSGMLKQNETLVLNGDMEITEPIKFSRVMSFKVNGNIKCSYPLQTENYSDSECFVYVKEGVDVSELDIRFDTPFSTLVWEGESPYESEERIAEVMNVESYNGIDLYKKYQMGGISWKRVVSITAFAAENPSLEKDLTWTLDGNVAYLAISYDTDLSKLKNVLLCIGMVDGSTQYQEVDLTAGEFILVTNDCTGDERGYKIITDIIEYKIPVVYIWIEDKREVESKEEYLSARVSISTKNAEYGNFPELSEREVLIRGRGHFTWNNFDKKPYKLRFEEKTSVLGMNPSKNWVLLANYVDRSLIQSYVAMEMGKVMTNLPYHSNQYPVDLFVNGTYRGVYTLGEQLEAKEERIDLEENYQDPDTDYLLEIGGSDEGDVLGRDYFHAGTIKFAAIKHPDSSELTNEQIAYLKDYVTQADNAVKNLSNYEDYIDIDSLIDWVIIHELTYNLDCCFRRSCYMIKEKNGKLKMGPIWDFDLAFGSYYRYQEGDFATVGESGGYVGVTWMNYLIKDPAFMEKFTARWNEIKEELLYRAISAVDNMSYLVAPSAEENFKVWDILGKSVLSQPDSHKKYDTYEKMVERLKDFINDRYNWLDDQLN